MTQDHLGSPRITTDANGNVISRRDFHPFGEEIYTTQRTQGLGYTSDNVRQKFTSYERDIESSLDFAQNRYQNYNLGRFTSPDPLAASATVGNPQSWNRYAYVLNNPTNLVDPLGLSAECPPGQNCFYNPNNQLVYLDENGGENVVDESLPPAMGFVAPPLVANPGVAAAAAEGTVSASVGAMLAYGVAAMGAITLLPMTIQAPTLPDEYRRNLSGIAKINMLSASDDHYQIEGQAVPHFSITVIYDGLAKTTDSIKDEDGTSLVRETNIVSLTPLVMPLPNALAAQGFQETSIDTRPGVFDMYKGPNCITHVRDVLIAGGVPLSPTAGSREVYNYLVQQGLKPLK